jgi:hypothetical protein
MKPPAPARPRQPIARLLAAEAGLTYFLVSLFLLIFVLYPLAEPRTITRYLLDAITLLVLLSGADAVSDRRRALFRCVVGLGALSFLLHVLPHAYLDRSVLLLKNASTMLFLIVVAGAVLWRVLGGGRITTHRVQGAVAVYLMLGLIWAGAYMLVFLCDPTSFDLGPSMEGAAGLEAIQTQGMSRLIYFSFVTMTTVGYGDITPQSVAAGNLAILQALTGQIYLVVILARLVSLAVATGERE